MSIAAIIDFFLYPDHFKDEEKLRQARLLVRASLLTSVFSASYIWLSHAFGFQKGVYLMIFNAIGFLALPFLLKTPIKIKIIGNLYITVGATAVLLLTYFSGGIWSGVYPWIISIPILALLVVGRASAGIWGAISLGFMIWYGWLAMNGVELPKEYDPKLHVIWYVCVLTGLLMILLFINFVFEFSRTNAIAELKVSNEILNQQKDKITRQSELLQEHIDEKDFYIQILSHDLKNPLGNIESLHQLILDEGISETQRNLLNLQYQSTKKAQDLIRKVLDVSLAESKIKVSVKAHDLHQIIANVIKSFEQAYREKRIILQYTPKNEQFVGLVDSMYFEQILDNLVSNALKFSNSGTSVVVDMVQNGTQIHVLVLDQGPGFRPEEMDRVFSKFARHSAQPTAGENSTGLGLSLVKSYIEKMDGRIQCESTFGKGSEFTISINKA